MLGVMAVALSALFDGTATRSPDWPARHIRDCGGTINPSRTPSPPHRTTVGMAIHALTRRRATCDFLFELWDFSLIRPVRVGVALGWTLGGLKEDTGWVPAIWGGDMNRAERKNSSIPIIQKAWTAFMDTVSRAAKPAFLPVPGGL